jgi:hypothetical protein
MSFNKSKKVLKKDLFPFQRLTEIIEKSPITILTKPDPNEPF